MSNLLDTPKLGFGCMRLPLTDPKDQKSIDIEHLKKMVDAFIEAGGTYFDTAYVYHEGESEVAMRKALVERYPRDSFTIATKCLAWAQPTAEDAKACLDTSLKRLGTDYIDFYLLHNMGGARTAKFDEYGMWEWAAQKKAEGVIKHLGFSMHDNAETLDKLLADHPDMDFVQLQVNYLDWEDPVVESRKCMEVAQKHGVPVVIMEPARGGRLADLPERGASVLKAADPDKSAVSWAYRFCYNLPNVISVLSGVSTLEQIQENVREWKANEPLSAFEEKALGDAVDPLYQLSLLRERLPRWREYSRSLGFAEFGKDDRESRICEESVRLANPRRSRFRLHSMRRLRGHVPARHQHHRAARGCRRLLRVGREKRTGTRFLPNEQGPAYDVVRKWGPAFVRYGISGIWYLSLYSRYLKR